MRNKFILIVLLLFLGSFSLSVNALAKAEGIIEFYESAKTKDLVIGRARARLEISAAEKDMSLSVLLPRMEATAAINSIDSSTLHYEPKAINRSYVGENYGVNLRQPLLQIPGAYGLAASRAGVRAAEATLQGASQELITRVAEAYLGILKAHSEEKLFADELKRLDRILEQSEAFLKAGTGDVIAVYEARARKDSAQADLVKAINQRRLSEQQLARVSGRPVTRVKGLGTYAPKGPEPADLKWWLEAMRQNQPALIQARETLQQAADQRKSARAGHYPVINASAGYNVSKGSTFLPDVETRQWSVGLNLTLPIYSGGETAARIRKAVAAESEQRNVLDSADEQLTQKLKEVYLTLEYNASLISALKQKMVSAELQLTAVSKGRSIGTRTAVDLLNAEQGYAASRRDLAGAICDNALQRLLLKAAAGNLTEKDLVELNMNLIDTPQTIVNPLAGSEK